MLSSVCIMVFSQLSVSALRKLLFVTLGTMAGSSRLVPLVLPELAEFAPGRGLGTKGDLHSPLSLTSPAEMHLWLLHMDLVAS